MNQEVQRKNTIQTLALLVKACIIIVLLICACYTFQSCKKPLSQLTCKFKKNKVENIPKILDYMQCVGVKDVNDDGLVNCIDYSITFYKLYGSNARIIINNNPDTGMNHLFIKVYYANTSIDIEPQGTNKKYMMSLYWGTAYNPDYNRDVTATWGGF